MRWKISHRNHGPRNQSLGNHGHGGHDPRQIDMVAIFALLIVIVAAFRFYSGSDKEAGAGTMASMGGGGGLGRLGRGLG